MTQLSFFLQIRYRNSTQPSWPVAKRLKCPVGKSVFPSSQKCLWGIGIMDWHCYHWISLLLNGHNKLGWHFTSQRHGYCEILGPHADNNDDNGNISHLALYEQSLRIVDNSRMPTNSRMPIMHCYKDISNDSDWLLENNDNA